MRIRSLIEKIAEKKEAVARLATENPEEKRTFEIEAKPEMLDLVEATIQTIKHLGGIGASRDISLFVDGDGCDSIKSLKRTDGKLMDLEFHDDPNTINIHQILKDTKKMSKEAAARYVIEKTAEEFIERKIVTQDDLKEVARVVHEINRHYNKLLMDREDPHWGELDDADKARRVSLLSETVPDIKKISAKKMHDMWMAQQEKEGWIYGDNYDAKKKTHPCIVSWTDLPDLEKAKDAMYLAVIKAMTELHFGIDKTIDNKIKEVTVGGETVLINKSASTAYKRVFDKVSPKTQEAIRGKVLKSPQEMGRGISQGNDNLRAEFGIKKTVDDSQFPSLGAGGQGPYGFTDPEIFVPSDFSRMNMLKANSGLSIPEKVVLDTWQNLSGVKKMDAGERELFNAVAERNAINKGLYGFDGQLSEERAFLQYLPKKYRDVTSNMRKLTAGSDKDTKRILGNYNTLTPRADTLESRKKIQMANKESLRKFQEYLDDKTPGKPGTYEIVTTPLINKQAASYSEKLQTLRQRRDPDGIEVPAVQRIKVYIDADDVLFDSNKLLVEYLNALGKHPAVRYQDIDHWDYLKQWYSDDDLKNAFARIVLDVKFKAGADKALKWFYEQPLFDTYVLTATYEENQPGRISYFEENLPWFPIERVIFDKDKSKYSGGILIDDAPHNIHAYQGIKFVVEAPWNKNEIFDGQTVRVKNLKEAYEFLMGPVDTEKTAAQHPDDVKTSPNQYPYSIEKALSTQTEKEVATMLANSHEYKTPNIDGALSVVKNYEWTETKIAIDKLQGINKPIKQTKVNEIVDTLKKNGKKVDWPFIIVDKVNGIRPQSRGKRILLDGHHRLEACKVLGIKEVPVYHGEYHGKATLPTSELRREIPNAAKTASHNFLCLIEKLAEKAPKMASEMSKPLVFGKRDNQHIEKLKSAGNSLNLTQIKYVDKKGNISVRNVEPYKLVDNDLWAYDPEKESIRRFKVKNIKSVKPIKSTYVPRWPVEVGGGEIEEVKVARLSISGVIEKVAAKALSEEEQMKKDLAKGFVNKNNVPKTQKNFAMGDNFRSGSKVKSKMSVSYDDKHLNEGVGYGLTSEGVGRVNQQLTGDDFYKDIPAVLRPDAPQSDIDARMDALKAHLAATKGRNLNMALGAGAGLLAGIPLAGRAFRDINDSEMAASMGALALLGTPMAGVLAGSGLSKNPNQEYVNRLSQEDIKILHKVLGDQAKDVSQDIANSQRVTKTNTHYYYV